jgi:hypothetical protein
MSLRKFTQLEYIEQGCMVPVRYNGAWLLVDNGYLRWPTTIPPFKESIHYNDIRFSEWLESMQKDVECTFGILKGRFRILKTGVCLHGVEATDKIWLTCCALHNYFLELDGLDETWESGLPSDWLGEVGEHNSLDVHQYCPSAVSLLLTPYEGHEAKRRYGTSGMGAGSDRLPDCDMEENVNVEQEMEEGEDVIPGFVPNDNDYSPRIVANLSFDYFQKKLVENFSIRYHNNYVI